jgi:hypothetical protein
MKGDKATMGGRLEEEIGRKYGSLKKAAAAIGVKSGSYFRPYLTGSSEIGMTLSKKLAEAGLDIEYIIEGKQKENTDVSADIRRRFEDMQYRLAQLSTEFAALGKMVNDNNPAQKRD